MEFVKLFIKNLCMELNEKMISKHFRNKKLNEKKLMFLKELSEKY